MNDIFHIRHIHIMKYKSEFFKHFGEQAIGAAIHIIASYYFIARL